jgi:haloalkane dehalogenase
MADRRIRVILNHLVDANKDADQSAMISRVKTNDSDNTSTGVKFEDAVPIPAWLQRQYPFTRKTAVIDGMKINFIDEGTGDYCVIMFHGNPTWSYLYRKVIGQLLMKKNVRVIAPDMVGFGLSEKVNDITIHTPEFHATLFVKLIEALGVQKFTVVGQDWGGPIAALVAARMKDRANAAVFMNTAIVYPRNLSATPFHRFSNMPLISDFVFRCFNFPVPIMDRVQGIRSSIGYEEKKAYNYPFQKIRDNAGPLALARMVPVGMKHPSLKYFKETEEWATQFQGKVGIIWGTKDPILGRAFKRMKELFPNTVAVVETDGGHFLQEEHPEKIASVIAKVTYENLNK